MIELLVEMARNLVIIIVVATILEMVMPVGKLKPLVQMTLGFFVIITILNPVLTLVFHQQNLSIAGFYLPEAANQEMDQAMAEGRAANIELQEQTSRQLGERLEGQIRGLGLLLPGVKDVKPTVKLDEEGRIEQVELVVENGQNSSTKSFDNRIPAFAGKSSNKADADLRRKLVEWISSYYGVSPDKINVTWK